MPIANLFRNSARNVYNIVGIVANVLTPRMLNPSAWNWGAKSGFFWAGSCLMCAVWTYFRLPEPKNRTYGELDILFEHHVPARKFKHAIVDEFTDEVSDEKDAPQSQLVEKTTGDVN